MKYVYKQDLEERDFYNQVTVNGIPEELIKEGKWCCYRMNRTSDGRYTKVPFQPITGRPANPRDLNTFTNFEEAYEDYCWELNDYAGIGILLTNDIALIDIDNSFNGQLSPLAKRIIKYFNSYTEISVSGLGIHILIKVDKKVKIDTNRYYLKNPYNKTEIYLPDTGRYATVTGNHLEETPTIIKNRTNKIERFLDQYMTREKPIIQKPERPINKSILSKVREISDTNLLGKIRSSKAGDKFISLFDLGYWEEGFNSPSEADMELAGILSFFTCGDYERIEKIMWQSELSRPKWEKNKNYLPNTIKKAIANCHNYYNPNY